MTDDLAAALARAERAERALAEYRAKADPPTVTRPTKEARFFYETDLTDVRFFTENKAAILDAAAHGRILVDPNKDWRAGTPASRARAAARKAEEK